MLCLHELGWWTRRPKVDLQDCAKLKVSGKVAITGIFPISANLNLFCLGVNLCKINKRGPHSCSILLCISTLLVQKSATPPKKIFKQIPDRIVTKTCLSSVQCHPWSKSFAAATMLQQKKAHVHSQGDHKKNSTGVLSPQDTIMKTCNISCRR